MTPLHPTPPNHCSDCASWRLNVGVGIDPGWGECLRQGEDSLMRALGGVEELGRLATYLWFGCVLWSPTAEWLHIDFHSPTNGKWYWVSDGERVWSSFKSVSGGWWGNTRFEWWQDDNAAITHFMPKISHDYVEMVPPPPAPPKP